jgi:murein DD-endopeptidase MepM/ murein hydrolase activator NlpD
MQLIITDTWLARTRAVHLSGAQMVLAFLMAALVLMLTALGLYHWVFLKGAREGWPIIGSVIKLVTKDEFDQRDRYLRENLDLMARQLGEMQAKLTQLESLGERVSGLAGVSVETHKSAPGQGGIQVGAHALSLDQVKAAMDDLETLTHQRTDLLTVLESRLFERRMKSMMVPTQRPVSQGDVGSPFGWRLDPMTGLSALHTGLDFPGPVGTPILAAAGGVVVAEEYHPAYGKMVEVDHGNELVTRYAHASRVLVKKGDLVKRGQAIAEMGNTGRSTGAHLHFEVLVQGIPQDPHKFLVAGEQLAGQLTASVDAGKLRARPAIGKAR